MFASDDPRGIGSYRDVSLKQAVAKAAELRAMVARGVDPVADKRQRRLRARVDGATLADALDQHQTAFASKPSSAVVATLIRRHCAPLLKLSVARIATDDVRRQLMPLQTALPKSHRRVLNALAAVFAFAKARGLRDGDNPADRATWRFLAPPPPKAVPHRMMAVDDAPAFYAELIARDTTPALALAFLVLTAARTSETLELRWSEVSLDQRLIVLPPARMKARREHRIPITDPAVELLHLMRARTGDSGLVFKARHGGALSSRCLEALLHRQMNIAASVHGFRAAFSSWGHERTEFPHELIELALAHESGRGDAVARSYNRVDAVERRRALMVAWAGFVAGEPVAGNVVPFAAAAR